MNNEEKLKELELIREEASQWWFKYDRWQDELSKLFNNSSAKSHCALSDAFISKIDVIENNIKRSLHECRKLMGKLIAKEEEFNIKLNDVEHWQEIVRRIPLEESNEAKDVS